MTYLTFETYKTMGGQLDDALFNRLEYRCEKLIDKFTQQRIKNDTIENKSNYKKDLEQLTFELIEIFNQDGTATGERTISGTGNDGVSISYESVTKDDLDITKQALILDYLNGIKDYKGIKLLSLQKAVV